MSLKTEYDFSDLREFDRLLRETERKGFNDFRRNIGRMKLNEWLEQWDKKTADEMFEQIKDW